MSSVKRDGQKPRILKFGGTSVATTSRRQRVAEIVMAAQRRGPVIVVTSAIGGVTDLLQDALDGALAGEKAARRAERIEQLRNLHTENLAEQTAALGKEPDANVRQALETQFSALQGCLDGVALLGDCPAGTRHRLLAFGERLALPLVSVALSRGGIEAVSVDGGELLMTQDLELAGILDPAVDTETSRQIVRRWWSTFDESRVPVVSGFVARDGEGRTTTLGRGASDLSATLLAGFLEAEGVDIWTDVNGVLSASPQWVASPKQLDYLSYSEATEMARLGARVLHPRTLEPLLEAAIPVCIRNTMTRHGSGTCIGPSPEPGGAPTRDTVRGVTALSGNTLLRLNGAWHRPLIEALDDLELKPLLWVHGSSGRSASVVLPREAADAACRFLRRQHQRQGDAFQLDCRPGVGLVAVIGALSRAPYCLGRLLESLWQAEIPTLGTALPCPEAASQEHAAVVLIHDDDVPAAVRCLHRDLVENAATPEEGLQATPYSAPLRRAQIRQEPSSRLL